MLPRRLYGRGEWTEIKFVSVGDCIIFVADAKMFPMQSFVHKR